MQTIADVLARVPSAQQTHVVRLTIAALNDQLVYETAQIGGPFWARIGRSAVCAALARAIESLRTIYTEADMVAPTVAYRAADIAHEAVDDTDYPGA